MTPEAIRRPRRGPCCAIAPVSALLLAFGALLAGTAHAAAFEGMFPSETLHIAPPPDADDAPAAAAPVTYAAPSYALPDRRELAALSLYRERGIASYYGRPFHGRKTSSGDLFDMYAMTAAHPTLPIPSYVRVTNLANGRSVVVRVNDRGPYHPGRAIDLSYTAAFKLGYADQGQANVEIAQVLPEEVAFVQTRPVPPLRRAASRPAPAQVAAAAVPVPAAAPPAPRTESTPVAAPIAPPVATPAVAAAPLADAASSPVFLQLGTFGSLVNAESFKTFVEHELRSVKETVSLLASDGKYRLHLGPFPSAQEARSMAERIATTLKLKPSVVQR
ncbi:MAG TPA: septal ring lytic transglycosylase RlpA family protein [Rhodocyclaceae bacterium]|uniref:septal ring lytic transglycosylase RlpA family protein n=3 Tax=Zoogloea sp. TaxID=49181 RepID=UPI002BC4D19B|nr:septal ring lytic transglycosylase RlpA family protein [Zoogloea sp.]HMW52356.1 septal ring lytic transglycosylase RlpA family protein [Rhodocyclaceae bacterium]HMZ75522.1 septal ring lytic transglycosylase RlpA family protein [Rhodocyclaceae bacterium]HNB65789.1 septal ring lytic transglycosylase RlpA family protein [Rhodocyclaceae bacterium]HNC80533.1 septal ring lytic transglycosylase RlpA family protein [Rhodocyclaceae bacterium]HND24866.1 septal ring lytic transglycosylase RlpA family 